jgi:hypothetical protein
LIMIIGLDEERLKECYREANAGAREDGCTIRRNMAHDKESFDEGWNAAIAEVKKEWDGYQQARAAGKQVDPIEEWLPRLLGLLAGV